MSTSPSDQRREPVEAAAPRSRLVDDDSPLIPSRSADDSDSGWGDDRADSNDERLLRDVPPHW